MFSLVCVLPLLFFLLLISLTDTAIHRMERIGWIIIFLAFHFHPVTKMHLIYRDFYHFFNQSICNYWTDSWWELFSLEICILFGFSLMQLSRSYWLSYFNMTVWEFKSYQTIIFLLQSERFYQLTLAQLVTTVYLSHLLNPTPSHQPLLVLYPIAKM